MLHARERGRLDVLLARHGTVRDGNLRLWGRATAIELSEKGWAEAQALTRALEFVRLEAVYSSPRDRARQTAAVIAAAHALNVRLTPSFDEMDFGDWTARSFADLGRDPRWRAFNESRASARVPGGESMSAVFGRTQDGLRAIERRHREGIVLVVSHAEVIRAILLEALGWSSDKWSRLPVDPASISIVTRKGPTLKPVVVAVNLTPDAFAAWSGPRESDDLPIHGGHAAAPHPAQPESPCNS